DKGACGFNHQPGLPGDWSELCTCCLGQYIEGEDIVLLDLRVQEVCVVSMVEFPFFSFKVPFKTFNCKFHYTLWYEGVVINVLAVGVFHDLLEFLAGVGYPIKGPVVPYKLPCILREGVYEE